MNEKELSDQLDESLEQLRAGVPIEQILQKHPAEAAILGPLLEAAAQMRQPSYDLPDFTEAQSRSRAAFLAESARLKPTARRKRVRLSLPFRLTGSIVLALGFLMAISGLASANSLPGDQLYPLKLVIEQVQIGLTANPVARLQMQQTFEQQRSNEASALIQQGRDQQVTFYGFVAVPKKGPVKVGGLVVTLPPEQVQNISKLAGSYVAVTGQTGPKGVSVIGKIHLQTVQLDGTLQNKHGNNWTVDGLDVLVNSATEIQGKPTQGQHVYINASRLPDGKLVAVAITLDQPDAKKEAGELLTAPIETPEPQLTKPTLSSRPTPTATPRPTFTPSPTKEISATSTKRARPTVTGTVQVKSTPTQVITPTAVRTDTQLPTPTLTLSAVPHRSQTPQNSQSGTQGVKRRQTSLLHNDQLTPTPTPSVPVKGRYDNSLAPNPNDNAGPLIQSSDPNTSAQQTNQPLATPTNTCLASPQYPDSTIDSDSLSDSQPNSQICVPSN